MKYIQNLRGKNEQEVLNALGDSAFPLLIGGGDENEDVKVFIDDNQESLNTRINTATDIQEAFNITYKPYIINGYDQRISLTTSLGYAASTYTAYAAGELAHPPIYYNYCKVSPVTFSSSNTSVATIDSNGIVTAIANGTTIIKVNFDGNNKYRPYEAQYTLTVDIPITVDPEPEYSLYNNHKYVDMGLPSGTMWSAYNMGAAAVNEAGDRYFWGNTTTDATPDQYASHYSGDDADEWSKYNDTDNLMILELIDDAAYANWSGNWRIPTIQQFLELCDSNNTSAIFVQNYLNRGINGILFTSVANNNTLFFPVTDDYGDGYPRIALYTNEQDNYGIFKFYVYVGQNPTGSPDFSDTTDTGFVTDESSYRAFSYCIRPVYIPSQS